MNVKIWAFAVPAMVAAFALPAVADSHIFGSEDAAQQTCTGDEVVFVNLDNGRFYHKSQDGYGKSKNGGYGCLKTVHAAYRESHD